MLQPQSQTTENAPRITDGDLIKYTNNRTVFTVLDKESGKFNRHLDEYFSQEMTTRFITFAIHLAKLKNTDNPLFSVRSVRYYDQLSYGVLGAEFLMAATRGWHWCSGLKWRHPQYRFHPYAELLLRLLMEEKDLVSRTWQYYIDHNPLEHTTGMGEKLCNDLNDLVTRFVEEAHSVAVTREWKHRVRAVNKNAKSTKDYIDKLLEWRPVLQVVRCDLTDGEHVIIPSIRLETAMWLPKLDVQDTQEISVVQNHHKQLQKLLGSQITNTIRNPDPDIGLVGYIWTLNYTVTKGFYYQYVFFVDGDCGVGPLDIMKRLGDLWQRATDGQGEWSPTFGYDWTSNKAPVAIVRRGDRNARARLEREMDILTKSHLFVQCAIGSGRTFGRSSAPNAAGRQNKPSHREPPRPRLEQFQKQQRQRWEYCRRAVSEVQEAAVVGDKTRNPR